MVLDPSYWASFKGSKWFMRSQEFDQVRLFYGRPLSSTSKAYLAVKVEDQVEQFNLEVAKDINVKTILDTTAERVRLNFQVPTDFPSC